LSKAAAGTMAAFVIPEGMEVLPPFASVYVETA
jgi:hypothetical protein